MNEEELEELIEQAKARMKSISQALYDASQNGESLTEEEIDAWFNVMSQEIAAYHQASALLGSRFGRPPFDEWSLMNDIRRQIGYLMNFANDIKQAGQFTGASMARAGMYGSAIRSTFWRSATDYIPLPAMPCDGTLCYTNCKCRWEIVTLEGDGNYDCYWRRGADDSCGTCIARESAWSPLLVRGGELQ